MADVRNIDEVELGQIKALGLPERREDGNAYLAYSCRGNGRPLPDTFVVKVYRGKRGLRLVCPDYVALRGEIAAMQDAAAGTAAPPVAATGPKRILEIDDSGWGFFLLGVLCGLRDSLTRKIYALEVPVAYFQGEAFSRHEYVGAFAEAAVHMVTSLDPPAPPNDPTIEVHICTGYINTGARDRLRALGYTVRPAHVVDELQDGLEQRHAAYVREKIGRDVYYDPKAVGDKGAIAVKFEELRTFVERNGLLHLCKTGWKSFSQRAPARDPSPPPPPRAPEPERQ